MRHPGVYLSKHLRCALTRSVSSTSGYELADPAQNQASPARDDRENGLTRKDMDVAEGNVDAGRPRK